MTTTRKVGFKGFDVHPGDEDNVSCRGLAYRLGETVVHTGPVTVGWKGLHMALELHSVFRFYEYWGRHRYGLVEGTVGAIADGLAACTHMTLLEWLQGDYTLPGGGQIHFQDGFVQDAGGPAVLDPAHNFMVHAVRGVLHCDSELAVYRGADTYCFLHGVLVSDAVLRATRAQLHPRRSTRLARKKGLLAASA